MHIHCLTVDTDRVVACVADTLNFLYKQWSGKWRCDIDSSQDRIKQCFLFRLRIIYLLFLWYKVIRCVSIFSFLNCKNIYHKSVLLAVSSLDPFSPPILLPPNTPPPFKSYSHSHIANRGICQSLYLWLTVYFVEGRLRKSIFSLYGNKWTFFCFYTLLQTETQYLYTVSYVTCKQKQNSHF